MKLSKTNGNSIALALLTKGIEVNGDVLFAEELHVAGKVSGKVTSETGTLLIAETGRVEAQVEVGVCIIRGILDGNVVAGSRIEIYKTGRVRGDLTTPVLLVEEGAVINGIIGMGKDASARLPEERLPDNDEEKIKVKSA
jgi:cytoskeletal protein CcmA (bactofilin family)